MLNSNPWNDTKVILLELFQHKLFVVLAQKFGDLSNSKGFSLILLFVDKGIFFAVRGGAF